MGGFAIGAFGEIPYGMWGGNAGSGVPGADPDIKLIVEPLNSFEGLRRVDYVQFRVRPVGAPIRSHVLLLLLNNGMYDVAYIEATGFSEPFVRGSLREKQGSSDIYTLRRTRGWQAAVLRLLVTGRDPEGRLVAGESA